MTTLSDEQQALLHTQRATAKLLRESRDGYDPSWSDHMEKVADELEYAAASSDGWRDLALQFDGHRIEALSLLRYISEADNNADMASRVGQIKAFLSKPPLSGEAVLAARLSNTDTR